MNPKRSRVQHWLAQVALIGTAILTPLVSSAYSRDTVLPPSAVMDIVIVEALQQNVAPELALAVARVESNFQTHVVSHAGARGVMQIMPRTARMEYSLDAAQLFNPHTNIRTGIHYLRHLINRYGRTDIALSHYNGGSKVRGSDGVLRVIPATRSYVNKVMSHMRNYRQHPKVLAAYNNEGGYRLAKYRPAAGSALDDFSDTSSPLYGGGLYRGDLYRNQSQLQNNMRSVSGLYGASAVVTTDPQRHALVVKLRSLQHSLQQRFASAKNDDTQRDNIDIRREERVAKVRSWEAY